VVLDKKTGETPLECLERYRAAHPELAEVPMTYAGRLDPLAEGALLILVGEECKRKAAYLGLDKEYELSVLFGVATDTHDMLGLVTGAGESVVDQTTVTSAAQSFVGTHTQPYPAFSSRTVAGKPLFQHAKDGNEDMGDRPTKEIEIYHIDFLDISHLTSEELLAAARNVSDIVKGDFRQPQIRASWERFFSTQQAAQTFTIARFHIRASSGTYMRWFADELGKRLNTAALAFRIRRTRIGTFTC